MPETPPIRLKFSLISQHFGPLVEKPSPLGFEIVVVLKKVLIYYNMLLILLIGTLGLRKRFK